MLINLPSGSTIAIVHVGQSALAISKSITEKLVISLDEPFISMSAQIRTFVGADDYQAVLRAILRMI